MDKQARRKNQKERGAALIIAILIALVMLLMAMPFLTKLSGEFRITEKTYRQLVALNLAEAGVERAIWELNYGNINSWEGDDNLRILTISSFQASGGAEVGDIVIEVTNPGGDNPFIQSRGRVHHTGLTHVDKTIRVMLEVNGGRSLFDCGIFGDEGVEMAGNAVTDSYDSREGEYGDGNRGEEGHTGTNASHYSCIFLRNNVELNGDAIVGPGADPVSVILTQNNSGITGEKMVLDEEKELPGVPAPDGLPFRGEYIVGHNDEDTICEDGEYTSFIIQSNSKVTVTSDATLYVSGGFSMESNTQLEIAEGVTLTVYLGGTFTQRSNSQINNLSQDPTKLQIYGTESFDTNMTWKSNSSFYGAVYVPDAEVHYDSNADFFGSIIGDYIEVDSNAGLHYDLALGSLGSVYSGESSTYRVKSWQEKIEN
ncbi:MAG: hypothetical protein PVF22_05050 [Candidatus Aminicenantes bacterium]|jgi:hypothetical protein